MTLDATKTIPRAAWRAALFLLGLGLCSAGAEGQWPSVELHQAAGSGWQGNDGDLAFDTDGRAWAAYVDHDQVELVVQQGNRDGSSWTFRVDHIVPGISNDQSIEVATCGDQVAVSSIDERCGLRFLWRDGEGVWLERTFAGSSCSGETAVAWDPLLQCDEGPSVAFRTPGKGKKRHWWLFWLATWEGEPVLVQETRDRNPAGLALAYDPTGRAAILFSGDRDPDRLVNLAFQDPAGGPWHTEIVYPRSDPPPVLPDPVHPTGGYGLAFDGDIPIAAFDAAGLDFHPIKLCRRGAALPSAPGYWTCEEAAGPEFEDPGANRSHLELDASGDLLVGYSAFEGASWRVRVSTRCPGPDWTDGALWGFGEIVAGPYDVLTQLSGLAIDPLAQQPAVLFWETDPADEYNKLSFAWRESVGGLALDEGGILCGDGVDNDCDGDVDGLDAGCSDVTCSGLVEECSDGDNNDCDARTDCDDADCATFCASLCLSKWDPCTSDEECCSGKCRGGSCK